MTPSHLDQTLPTAERVELLLAEMTAGEKAGQLFHTMAVVGPGGTLVDGDFIGLPPQREMVLDRSMTHFNMLGAGTAVELATWHNALQDLASESRLQIPITVSTDPRHSFTQNVGTGQATSAFSVWPEALGLAAIGDEALVEQFADICRQDYVAVGIRTALHPQLDLATEPRWARTGTTFGEDVDLVSRLGAAYVRGLVGNSAQGSVGRSSVAAMIKHFPGGGPLRDGEDSHFRTGREQVYPGGHFDTHLQPFRTAIAAGSTHVMPSYGIPMGTEFDEVACGANRGIITTLLRERLGFDGVVCTDWGLITDATFLGQEMPARAWGIEHLSPLERAKAVLDAGADQFGGEFCTELVIELVERGLVDEARLDQSVRRLLHDKFALGLFDRTHVEVDDVAERAGTRAQRRAGHEAQARSITVLTNDRDGAPVLPLSSGTRVCAIGIDGDAFGKEAHVVEAQADADVTVIRIAAPFEPRPGAFESHFHQGSLEFDDAELDRLCEIMHAGPTVVVVRLDRPGVLTPLAEHAAALLVDYGCSDTALVDALFGRVPPAGRLPVDLPRSMAAVVASDTDTPCSTLDPLFGLGHGLAYDAT